jgi:sodium transport system permease protein
MEALLLTPATKLQITLGKLLAVSTVAVASVIIALAALFVALSRFPLVDTGTETTLSLGPAALAQVAVLGVLLAVSFAALELALGVFARSFKEAQNFITPLYLVALLPVVAIAVIPGFKPGLAFYLIPALNTVLVFKEALLGSGEVLHVVLSVATMLLFCAACVGVTLRIFSNERVLLRS